MFFDSAHNSKCMLRENFQVTKTCKGGGEEGGGGGEEEDEIEKREILEGRCVR